MPEIRDSYAYANDLRVHYRRCGLEEGQPVVLLHGLASSSHIWDLVAPRLGERFHVVAPDQRGHGLTDKPDDGYDFATVAADLAALVQTLGLERPVVVGHSWGASVALEYAAGRSVGPWAASGLALVDGGLASISAMPGMTWEKAEVMMRPPDLAGTPREEFIARMPSHAPDPAWLTPQIVDIVLANFEIMEDDTIRPHLRLDRHMRIARALYDQNLEALYPRVRCPALLAPAAPPGPRTERAEQFLAAKHQGVALAEKLMRQSETHWFDDTWHDIPLHRPEALAALLEQFIDRTSR